MSELTAIEISDSFPQRTIKKRLQNLFGKDKSLYVYIYIIFFLSILFLIGLWFRYKNVQTRSSNIVINYLSVTSVSPRGTVESLTPDIKIHFNLPVTAHHIADYISISPSIAGHVEQGISPNEVIFKPTDKFPRGALITVRVLADLPSDSGKKLMSDYIFNFYTSADANSISFVKDNRTGKFMSFQVSKGVDLNLEVGSQIQNPQIKVYKADVKLLLDSLIYQTDNPATDYPGYGTYIQKDINTKNLQMAKELKDIKNGDQFVFTADPGIYLLEALDGEVVLNTAWVSLTSLGIHLRQDDKKLVLAAQNLETGQSESGVEVSLYKLLEEPTLLESHILSGIQSYTFDVSNRLDLIVGQKGSEIVIIPVQIPNSQAEIRNLSDLSKNYKVFLYTDRPIYKKGATVAFRGIVRQDNDAAYSLPSLEKIRVYESGQNSEKFDQMIEIGDGGVFSGEIKLPEDVTAGGYYLTASTNLDKMTYSAQAYANFEVFDYIKPEFGLESATLKSEYIKPETITATVIGAYFDGRKFADQKVNYTIYSKDYYETEKAVYNSSFNINSWGGMCGGGGFDEYYGEKIGETQEVVLNTEGSATVNFSTTDLTSQLSQEVTIVFEKVDENGNKIVSAKNVIVHQGEFNVFFRPGPSSIRAGEEFKLNFYSEDLVGTKLSHQEFIYEVYKETWSRQETTKDVVQTGTITTDENGVGSLSTKLEKTENNNYFIELKTKDHRGNEIRARRGVYVIPSGTKYYSQWFYSIGQTMLKITSSSGSFKVGDTAQLEIISPTDMSVLVGFERGRIYDPQWLNLKAGSNVFDFKITEDYSPSITPTFSFFYNGNYYIEGLELNVPAMHKLIEVEISTDKETYKPGDTALITIITKDHNKNLISAKVGLGLVDKAIYALRKNAAPPLHSSFYFFRRRNINTSSSLTWIGRYNDSGGGGGGGGGMDSFSKDSDTLFWNPNLETGSDGQVKVEVPVGDTQTTWRILTYASSNDTKVGQATKDVIVKN